MVFRFTIVLLLAVLCAGSALAQETLPPPRYGTITIDDSHLVHRSVIRAGGSSTSGDVTGLARFFHGLKNCQGVTTEEPTFYLDVSGSQWNTLQISATPPRLGRWRSHANGSGLVVRDPVGDFYCNQNFSEENDPEWDFFSSVVLSPGLSGRYYIWVTTVDYRLVGEDILRRSAASQPVPDGLAGEYNGYNGYSGYNLTDFSIEMAVNIRAYSSNGDLTMETRQDGSTVLINNWGGLIHRTWGENCPGTGFCEDYGMEEYHDNTDHILTRGSYSCPKQRCD